VNVISSSGFSVKSTICAPNLSLEPIGAQNIADLAPLGAQEECLEPNGAQKISKLAPFGSRFIVFQAVS